MGLPGYRPLYSGLARYYPKQKRIDIRHKFVWVASTSPERYRKLQTGEFLSLMSLTANLTFIPVHCFGKLLRNGQDMNGYVE